MSYGAEKLMHTDTQKYKQDNNWGPKTGLC